MSFVSQIGGAKPGEFASPNAIAVDGSGNVYVVDGSNNGVQKFSSSGALILKWGSNGRGKGQFNNFSAGDDGGFAGPGPRGIAVDGAGNIYVADTANSRIEKFSSSGTFLTEWGSNGTGVGQFRWPTGVAVAPSGDVYVADSNNERVDRFSSAGQFVGSWGGCASAGCLGDGQFNNPQGVAVDASGNVFVVDVAASRVQEFSSAGAFVAKWGSRGSNDGQFNGPRGIAVDGSGNVYVADNGNSRIQKFSSSGQFLTTWGSSGSGDGQFVGLASIAVDSLGNTYATDTATSKVQSFSSVGAFTRKWGSQAGAGTGEIGGATSVAVDSSGNVYVLAQDWRVAKFSASGQFVTQWGGYGEGNGKFSTGFGGIAIDGSDNIYVSDNALIQKFSPSGVFLASWSTGSSGANGGGGLAIDASGDVFAATNDNVVRKFSSAGALLATIGAQGSGDGQFESPQGVAVSASGDILVVDSFGDRIERFSSTGTYLGKWGTKGTADGQFGGSLLGGPVGIAIDPVGDVLVGDAGNARVQKFSSSGQFIRAWGSYGGAQGETEGPSGIAVAPTGGTVLVADPWNGRVLVYSDSGDPTPPTPRLGDVNGDGHVRIGVLGDSYISGEGAATPTNPYLPGTDLVPAGPGQNLCHKSMNSWAARIAEQLAPNATVIAPTMSATPDPNADQILFAACSGATTSNITGAGQYSEPSQLAQLQSFGASTVDALFVSLGGNDAGFANIIQKCLLSSCDTDPTWQQQVLADVQQAGARVWEALDAIHDAAPQAEIYLMGYPDPFIPPNQQCIGLGALGWTIGPAEQQWIHQTLIPALDTAESTAANFSGAHYLDPQSLFANAGPCSASPDVSGIRLGDDKFQIFANESFHPNSQGHSVMTNMVAAQLLTTGLIGTNPDTYSTPAPENSLAMKVEGTQVLAESTTGHVVIQNGPPNTVIVTTNYSVPEVVATGTTDANGNLNVGFTVPGAAVPGEHHLVESVQSSGQVLGQTSYDVVGDPGTYVSLPPARILDTRSGLGLSGPFGPQQIRQIKVTGTAGVPPAGVSAVVLNVTATQATANGWLTLFPSDATLPTASNLNFVPGESVPNLAVVKVGHGGANEGTISISNTGGASGGPTVDVVADVAGYYTDATAVAADKFVGVTPVRVLDTRNNVGLTGKFGPQQTRPFQVGGAGGVPANADSVVMNVTATDSTAAGWLTLNPTGQSLPTASNLNFGLGKAVANLVTVKVGSAGQVDITNTGGIPSGGGAVDVVGDVVGYYQSTPGSVLNPIAPQRVLDTRSGLGGTTGPVAAQGTVVVDPHSATGIPAVGSYTGVILNVTATSPAAGGWLTAYPSDATLPTASNLNFSAGQTVANLVKLKVGADGRIKITNTGGVTGGGAVQIIVDIVGYYS